jgi:hypothetical protein
MHASRARTESAGRGRCGRSACWCYVGPGEQFLGYRRIQSPRPGAVRYSRRCSQLEIIADKAMTAF